MYEKRIFKKYNRSIYENNLSLYTQNTKVYRWNKGSKKKVGLFNEVPNIFGDANVSKWRKVTEIHRNGI